MNISLAPRASRLRARLLASAFLLGTPGIALAETPATATETPAEAPGAEAAASTDAGQILVSGKRGDADQAVQRTPASITALSGDKLAAQGITNVRELGTITPNLFQTRTAVSYLNTNIFIRGVGETDAQGEPSVGIYLDGIYVPKNLGAQQELLDIDQVNIYRGPQGQAFGHSAQAGALVINTITPDRTPRLKAQVAYGNYNDARIGIAASGPLSDDFLGGLAVSYHRRDGTTRNVTLGRDTNNINYLAGRTKLRYAPDDRFDVTLTLSGVRDRSTARGVSNYSYGDRDAHNQIFPKNRYNQLAATLTANYAIDDNLTLTSVSGAYGFHQTAFFDNTGDYYGRGSQYVRYKDNTFQEELRLTGDYGAFDFVSGIYAYREDWFTNRRANTAANSTSVVANIRYAPIYSLIQQNTTNLAGYTEAHFAATDKLRLTAGVRYNWEHHSNANDLFYLSGANASHQSDTTNFLSVLFSDPGTQVWSLNGKKNWGTWAPKGSIDYTWQPGLLQYVTVSQGTKSAGYDYRAQTPSNPLQATTPYDPEKVTNYETGFKTEWADGRIKLNVSAFYIRFDDIQLTVTDPQLAISHRFNAGKGATKGAEFEATLRPTSALQFDLSGSYLHARLTRFDGTAAAATTLPEGWVQRTTPFKGAVLPYSPKWQGRVSAQWTVPIPIDGTWIAQGAVQYQGRAFSDATNSFTTVLPKQTYIDGQITYTTPNDHWSFALSGHNLANKHYAQGISFTKDTATSTATVTNAIYRSVNYNDPRTVLFTVTYKK